MPFTTNAQDAPSKLDGKAELLRLQVAYQKSLREVFQSHENKIVKLGIHYADALEKLLAKVKQAGDLDKTLAVTNEIRRFGEEKNMSAKPPNSPEMVRLRSAYQTHASTGAADKDEETLSLMSKYDGTLEDLQKSLVRNDKIDEAEAVQAERKKVIKSAAYRNAKKGIASRPLIAEIQAAAPKNGKWAQIGGYEIGSANIVVLHEGARVFRDRKYALIKIPNELKGFVFERVSRNAALSSRRHKVTKAGKAYLGLLDRDSNGQKWAKTEGWKATDLKMTLAHLLNGNDGAMTLYEKHVASFVETTPQGTAQYLFIKQ